MLTIHTGNGQPMTKLMILQQAVNVITGLEGQVRGNIPELPALHPVFFNHIFLPCFHSLGCTFVHA